MENLAPKYQYPKGDELKTILERIPPLPQRSWDPPKNIDLSGMDPARFPDRDLTDREIRERVNAEHGFLAGAPFRTDQGYAFVVETVFYYGTGFMLLQNHPNYHEELRRKLDVKLPSI